jgi:hypothetical protein
VGRIIRARNPSSAGAVDLGRLCREGCLRRDAEGGGPREGRLWLVVLRIVSDFWVLLTRLGDRAVVSADPAFTAPLVPPLVRPASAPSASLEREDEVGAVREDGSFAGFVGDFGLGLIKPVEDGTGAGFLAGGLVLEEVAADCPFDFVVVVNGLVVISVVGLVAFDAVVVAALELDLTGLPGVTGVFGSAGDLVVFDAKVDVLLVGIGAGFEDLPGVALSLGLAEDAVFSFPVVTLLRSSPVPELPFRSLPPETAAELVVSAGRSFVRSSADEDLSGFPVGFFAACLATFGSAFGVGCLLPALDGISRANSGIVSSMSTLFFLAWNSSAMDCFLSVTTFGSVASFSEKFARRFAMLGSSGGTVVSFLRPHCMPDCPFRSTATKLVRTLDSGRGDALLLPA